MNKIVIDSRYYGKSGIGQTNRGILDSIDDFSNIILLGDKEKFKGYKDVEIIDNKTNPFSRQGLFLSKEELNIINKSKCFFSPAYIVPFGIKIPIYTTMHDCIFFDEDDSTNGFFDKLIKKIIYKRTILRSKLVFTISNFSKSRIQSIFHVKDEKLKIITSGCLSKDIIEYKKSHSLVHNKENSIIFVGNIKKHKGLDTLISAFLLARESNPTLKLYIVGNTDGLRTTYNLNEDLLKDSILIKKNLANHEMFDLISKCKYLVLPSRYEGMGLTPLEALYLGTNVILNDIEVLHEFYDNNENVTFFSTNSVEDLANKINTVSVYKSNDSFFERFDYHKTLDSIFKIINSN